MSFIEELKRRNVFKVGIAYLVASWLLLQLTEVLTELLELSTDIGKIVIILLVVGFVPALIFAWAFEMTPEGIKREKDVDRSASITSQTGRKLDYTVIAMLALIAAYFIWESRFKDAAPAAPPPSREIVDVAPLTAEAPPVTAADASPQIDSDAIAVLPFANRSNVEEDLFFTDGIHDDLLTQLAKIGGLKVISRTSVMEYRDTTRKIPEIAAELGVGKILEGGVQRAGDRVRINAQLIDVTTDQHLWAETFNREMTIDNIFDIQSEITTRIVTAIKGELTDADRATLSDRPTDNLRAWEAFLHARAIVAELDYTADKYQRAEPFAREAVELDPNFAEAWADLATIQMQGIWIGFANTEAQREQVRQNIARAERLAPNNPGVVAARADYHYRVEIDFESALALVDKAIALAPGDAELHRDRGLSLRRLGRWEEAVDAFQRCLELDPLNGFAASTLSETLTIMNAWDRVDELTAFWLRRNPDSGDLLNDRALVMIHRDGDLEGARKLLDRPADYGTSRAAATHAWVATMLGEWDRAIELERKNRGTLAIFSQTPDFRLGAVYAMRGDLETARGHFQAYMTHLDETPAVGIVENGWRNANLAVINAWLGDYDRALRHAELAQQNISRERDHIFGSFMENTLLWVRARAGQTDEVLTEIAAHLDAPGGLSRWQLYLDPAWDFLRDDPRFNELVRPDGVDPEPFGRLGDGT